MSQGKHFKGKDHFLDEIRLSRDDSGSGAQGRGEEVQHGEPEKHAKGIVQGGFVWLHAETSPEDDAKDESVQAEHEQWIRHQPKGSEITAPVLGFHVADQKLPQQPAMTSDVRQDLHKRFFRL